MPVKITKILSLGVAGGGQAATLQLREDGMFELLVQSNAYAFTKADMQELAAFINSEAPVYRDPMDR